MRFFILRSLCIMMQMCVQVTLNHNAKTILMWYKIRLQPVMRLLLDSCHGLGIDLGDFTGSRAPVTRQSVSITFPEDE